MGAFCRCAEEHSGLQIHKVRWHGCCSASVATPLPLNSNSGLMAFAKGQRLRENLILRPDKCLKGADR